MANHFSALKRARQTTKRTATNRANTSRLRTALRTLRETIEKGDKATVDRLWSNDIAVWRVGARRDNDKARALRVIELALADADVASYGRPHARASTPSRTLAFDPVWNRTRAVYESKTSLFAPANDRLYLGVRASGTEPAAIWVFRPQP